MSYSQRRILALLSGSPPPRIHWDVLVQRAAERPSGTRRPYMAAAGLISLIAQQLVHIYPSGECQLTTMGQIEAAKWSAV